MIIPGIKVMTHIQRCSFCGQKVWMQGYNEQNRITHIMNKNGLCYECAYWQELHDYPQEYMEIINHQCVRLHPVANKNDKTLILGGKGKMRYFMRPDETVFKSNDIWIIGSVPERFWTMFPTTVFEISLKAYRQLSKSSKKCQARACLDRYQCFRYNRAIENDERGPFNTIPPKWNIGDEHCRFFINIQDIKK